MAAMEKVKSKPKKKITPCTWAGNGVSASTKYVTVTKPGNHDNGAVGTTNDESKRNREKEITMEKLMEELANTKAELAKVRSEKDALQLSVSTSNVSNEFQHDRSGTAREDSFNTVSDTLLTRVNNMSLSSMNIPECKPSEGEMDIDKKGYEYWKNILLASLNLIQATEESPRMNVFKIHAGPKLLELLQGTKSSSDMPDENSHPFSNAIARLDNYFGSRAYTLSQRSKLLNMIQRTGETNTQYVRRVAASAKLCGYDKNDDEMEAVARTVMKGSTDKRVRTLAHRNWVKQGSLNDLIDLVRDHETELSNEEEFQRIHNLKGTASVAAITTNSGERGQFNRRGMGRFNNVNRGRSYQHVPSRKQDLTRKACWRCASTYHDPDQCPCINKVCHNCNRQGHLSRCCIDRNRPGTSSKRQAEPIEDAPPKKIAAIKNEEDKSDNALPDAQVPLADGSVVIDEVISITQNHQVEEDAYVIARVAGMRVIFFIDSGAQVNTITATSFKKNSAKGDST